MSKKFFQKTDWIACWATFVVALIVYTITLQPTVGLEDSGELIVASDYLGVPHPPGYPSWSLLTWLFQWIFHHVTYHGHPNPAWAVNFFSAFAGAGACATIAMLISRSGRDIVHGLAKTHETAEDKSTHALCATAGIVGGLLLAFGHGMWSQSVITEVYSLNVFFEALVMIFLYRWMMQPEDHKWLITSAFILGLGVTNHQTLVLLVLALAFGVLFRDQGIFRDFAILGSLILIFFFGQKFAIDIKADKLLETIAHAGTPQEWFNASAARTKLMQSAWHNGPQYAGFWTFLIPIVSIPILLALKPRIKGIAWITLAFILLFAGMDQTAKWKAEKAKNSIQKTVDPLERAHLQKAQNEADKMRIFYMKTKVERETQSQTFEFKGFSYPPGAITILFIISIPFLLWLRLPHGRLICFTFLSVLAGLAFYIYMPLSSDQNPPINWGYPRNWEGFVHAFARKQYEQVKPVNPFTETAHFINQCRFFLTDLRSQYLPLVLVGLLPFTAWRVKRFNAVYAGIAAFLPAAAFMTAATVTAIHNPDATALVETLDHWALPFTLVLFLLFCVGMGLFMANFIEKCIKETFALFTGKICTPWEIISAILITLLGLILMAIIGVLNIFYIKNLMQSATNPEAWNVLATVGAIILPPAMIIGAYLLKRWHKTELTYNLPETSQHWFMTTAVAFLSVGIGFVILQNPKMDLQNLFIEQVQYLLSHAIFVLWIGYGLLLAMTEINLLTKDRRSARYTMMAIMLCLPALLIAKNNKDPEQHLIYGRADQGGHDFGWQYGNWQLQGVKGIEEDLRAYYSPEEFEKIWAAYPTPGYPQPMGTNAIFFGGTDPGRFVPTYMIYSAHVRSDVYLITQNALADSTYMEVMRDLYGDQIWIPTGLDLNKGFQMYNQIYGADVIGGKMQVQGAQQVMKINGFLTQMIFDHNQFRTEKKNDEKTRPVGAASVYSDPELDAQGVPPQRSFYVEESSPLEWMYPYLIPHGLIMKINNEPTQITEEMIQQDMDFWSWYIERLLADDKFINDIPARKSFSKLRSSIAGLYAEKPKSLASMWKNEATEKEKAATQLSKQAAALRKNASEMKASETKAIENLRKQAGILTNQAADLRKEATALKNQATAVLKTSNMFTQKAEEAYWQAMELYPMSQEANIRLAYLMAGQGRFDEAIELMDHLIDVDKFHMSAPQIKQGLEFNRDLTLIQKLTASGDTQEAEHITQTWVQRPDLQNPQMVFKLAQLMANAKCYDTAASALERYTELQPRDTGGWLNLGALYLMQQNESKMWSALSRAVQLDPKNVSQTLQTDPRFASIRNTLQFKELIDPPSEKKISTGGLF